MLPHPPAFLHGAIFCTAYAESDNATVTMLPQCMRRHAAHPPVQSTRLWGSFGDSGSPHLFEDPIACSYKYYLWREVLSGAGSDLPVPFLDASTESQKLMAVCSMHRMSPSRKSKTIKQISLKTSRIHPGLLHSASEISWQKHIETKTVVSLRRVFSVRHRLKFQAV